VRRKFLEYSEVKKELPTWSKFSVPLTVRCDKKFRGRNASCGDELNVFQI
jgi:hypothetical protein